MELLVKRKTRTALSTIGDFFVNGKFFSNTLEDHDRGLTSDMPIDMINHLKVKNETCIPTGRYKVVKYFSPAHQKDMPLLKDVPGYAGVEIHSGNSQDDVKGCLLLGTAGDKPDWVSDSRAAIDKFYSIFFDAVDKGEEVWIVYE